MNQRSSSGLPLRAMVMVLLFLGGVFLLVGFQAMGSGSDSGDDDSPVASAITTTTTSPSEPPPAPPPRPELRVFNISTTEGAAQATATQLRDAGWDVAEVGDINLEGIPTTTVFFTDAPGEREAADEVGQLLGAPVQPRPPPLAEQPPGVIVAVTG